ERSPRGAQRLRAERRRGWLRGFLGRFPTRWARCPGGPDRGRGSVVRRVRERSPDCPRSSSCRRRPSGWHRRSFDPLRTAKKERSRTSILASGALSPLESARPRGSRKAFTWRLRATHPRLTLAFTATRRSGPWFHVKPRSAASFTLELGLRPLRAERRSCHCRVSRRHGILVLNVTAATDRQTSRAIKARPACRGSDRHMTLLVAAIAATVTAIIESTITPYLRVGDAQPHLVFVMAVVWTVAVGLDSGLVWAFVGGLALDTLDRRPLGTTAFALLVA